VRVIETRLVPEALSRSGIPPVEPMVNAPVVAPENVMLLIAWLVRSMLTVVPGEELKVAVSALPGAGLALQLPAVDQLPSPAVPVHVPLAALARWVALNPASPAAAAAAKTNAFDALPHKRRRWIFRIIALRGISKYSP
jgi:hypothetical protein